MTNDDRVAGLELALEPQDRKGSPEKINVGGLVIRKTDGSNAYGADAANLLLRNNGTLVWDRDDVMSGSDVFNNIYEYAAAEIHVPNQNHIRDRVAAAEDYVKDVRAGFQTLAGWLDTQFGVPLYRCTGPGSGNKVIAITVNPDFVVNADTGETASEIQVKKDTKAISGNLDAAFRRLGRERGEVEARRILNGALKENLRGKLPSTRRDRIQ